MAAVYDGTRGKLRPRMNPVPERRPLVAGLGPLSATALVAGNMIGSGIFVMPGSLAEQAGPVSLVAWLIVALGFLALTGVFADLGGAFPSSGGPTAFVHRAFGPTAGLVVAWLYWSCVVIGNAGFLTAFVAYLAVFLPWVKAPLPAFLVAQALLWSLTLVNALGVKAGGAVQTVTTVLKVLPLLLLVVVLVPHADTANLAPFAPHGLGAILPSIALVSWLFVGSESITGAGEEVAGGGVTIRRAAYAGYLLATAIYVGIALSLSLALPAAEIAGRADPLAVVALRFLGTTGQTVVSAGALISIAGVLNGWLLVAGRVPLAAADAGYAPRAFAAIHPRTRVPLLALLVSSAATSVLASLYFVQSLLDAYEAVVLLATATSLAAIGAACLALVKLVEREPDRFPPAARRRARLLAIAGYTIVLLMITGAGTPVILLTGLCAVAPLPFRRAIRR